MKHQAGALAGPAELARREARRLDAGRPWYRYAERLLPERCDGPWLDLGCGQGEFLALGQTHGLHGMGLDVSRSNVQATLKAGHPSLLADLNQPLPLRSACLAGVSMIEVIEHVVHAEALVEELARVIRPGGWLLTSTPNVAHWTYRWRALTGHPPKQEGRHYRFFVRSTFAALFERAGFELRGRASFGKQAALSALGRLAGRGRGYKLRYAVPPGLESLLAQHLVWRFERV